MKKCFAFLFILTFAWQVLYAQERIEGKRYGDDYRLYPTDKNVLIHYPDNESLFPFMIKGTNPFDARQNKVGFIDRTGKIIIQPKYTNCSYFDEKHAWVEKYVDNKRFEGIIDRDGKEVIPLIYDYVVKCDNGLFFIYKNKSIALVNSSSDTLISFYRYSAVAPTYRRYWGENDVGTSLFQWEPAQIKTIRFEDRIGVLSGKKWAIIDKRGKEVVPPTFDFIYAFTDGLAIMNMDKKLGLTNTDGRILAPALYDQINIEGDIAYVKNGIKWGVISTEGKSIIPVLYQSVKKINKGYVVVDNKNKAALFDKLGRRISSFERDNKNISDILWGNDERVYLYINSKKFKSYDGLIQISDKHLLYKKSSKWGVIDTLGKEKTPPIFDEVSQRKAEYYGSGIGAIAVKRRDKWGVIDGSGKFLLDCIYDDIAPIPNYLLVKNNSKYGLVNKSFVPITAVKYDSIIIKEDFGRDRTAANVMLNGKWGLINHNGKELMQVIYPSPIVVDHDLAFVKSGGKIGLLNLSGKMIVPCIYDDIYLKNSERDIYLYDQRLIVKKDSSYGLIDTAGRIIMPAVYQKLVALKYPFEKKYQATLDEQVGMIDGISGHTIIPCKYDSFQFPKQTLNGTVYYIFGRLAGSTEFIELAGRPGISVIPNYTVIDLQNAVIANKSPGFYKDEKLIIPPEYDAYEMISDNLYRVYKGGKRGLIDKEGNVLVEANYDKLEACGNNVIVKKNGKFGVSDLRFETKFDMKYSAIECSGNAVKTIP